MPDPRSRPNLPDLAQRLLDHGPVKTLATSKRVRILFGGEWVADTTSAVYVWEHEYYPFYYVPASDFREGALVPSTSEGDDDAPKYRLGTLRGGNGTSTDRVVIFGTDLSRTSAQREGLGSKLSDVSRPPASNNAGDPSPSPRAATSPAGDSDSQKNRLKPLEGCVRVEFDPSTPDSTSSSSKQLSWYEEDTRIHIHPKDPFRRVDVLFSARPLKVELDGRELAAAGSSFHLYETGLPTRYYLPVTSISDWTLLRDSERGTRTGCPYKGWAEYYDVVLPDTGNGEEGQEKGGEKTKVFNDIIWYYKTTTVECAAVAGFLCFYNEKVDIELDGKRLDRPKTVFSQSFVGEKEREGGIKPLGESAS